MTKSNKRNTKLTLSLIAFILLVVMSAGVFVLGNKPDENRELLPIVTDSPIYFPIEDGKSLTVSLAMSDNVSVKDIELLMVNTSSDGTGNIDIDVTNPEDSSVSYAHVGIPESEITVGKWIKVPTAFDAIKDVTYDVTITPTGCSPYLMYVPGAGMNTVPYTQNLNYDTKYHDGSVSLGIAGKVDNPKFNTVSLFPTKISIIFVMVISFAIIILIIWSDKRGMLFNRFEFLGDIFLLIMYIFICMGIYSVSYRNGIYITSDSSYYLREACALKQGFGFGYDAMAGYKSWFASWPILYPFMIFLTMLITGQEVYISSKILTCILILAIMLVLRFRFKNKTWVYALCLLNLGFLGLTYYSWSEIPFILFMLLFAFKLGDIVDSKSEKLKIWDYVLLGLYGLLTFLTRYFGIYLWIVVGGYIALYLLRYIKSRNKGNFIAALKLTITAFISGMLSIGYLFLNKIMNGMPSGVSRSTWWDDYKTLTIDLINSLYTEIFNVFHIDVAGTIGSIPLGIKIAIIAIVALTLILICVKCLKIFSHEGVFIVLGASYYAIFTVIRYFSSMDTFYFRFFEPASFLLTVGFIMILLRSVSAAQRYMAPVSFAIVLLAMMGGIIYHSSNGLCTTDYNYYDVALSEWDRSYAEIPSKSVIIFSDMDFRSRYFRCDVIEGEITTDDTWDDIVDEYYGSAYLCIRRDYAESMAECGEYSESVTDMLLKAIEDSSEGTYLSIKL